MFLFLGEGLLKEAGQGLENATKVFKEEGWKEKQTNKQTFQGHNCKNALPLHLPRKHFLSFSGCRLRAGLGTRAQGQPEAAVGGHRESTVGQVNFKDLRAASRAVTKTPS